LTNVTEIDAERLVLRPIDVATARVLLEGRTPSGLSFAEGYATDALRALLTELLARVDIDRVVAETMVEHSASRRVMEKAGMRQCGRRTGEEGGATVELVMYEARPVQPPLDGPISRD
jgi:hypothetical protein